MRRSLREGARVLVRMPAWLGDFVAAEPVVRALLARGCRVTVAGARRFEPLLEPHPRLGFASVERGVTPSPRAWRGHDVAIVLDGSWRGAWAACVAGIPERVGFASGARRILLTHAFEPALERGATAIGNGVHGARPRRLPRPFSAACVELASSCGLEVTDRVPRVHVGASARESLDARLARYGVAADERVFVVHAGARPESSKGLPPDLTAALVRELAVAHAAPRVVIPCAPGEETPARRAHELLPGSILLDAPPLDVSELAALHDRAACVLTPDSGPRHVAHARTDAPTWVVCGSTDPRHTAEHGPHVRIVRVDVPCGPCHREVCPLAGDARNACMRRIEPRHLLDGARSVAGH